MAVIVLDTSPALLVCPRCQKEFAAKRKDQRFCARACQKNATRGPRTVAESWTERARSEAHIKRALELGAWLYTTPPGQRLNLMAMLVRAARDHDVQLRNILTDPRWLGAPPNEDWRFFRRAPGVYRTIAQAANIYCREFWGAGVAAVVRNRCPEPETGEIGGLGEEASGAPPRSRAKSASTQYMGKPLPPPEGWDYRLALIPACRGLLWLTPSRKEMAKLRTASPCLPALIRLHTYNGEMFRGTGRLHFTLKTISAAAESKTHLKVHLVGSPRNENSQQVPPPS